MQVTINGESRSLSGFSAFKAFCAMQILADAEEIGRDVLNEAASFKREYEAANYVEMTRAEARREFPPKPLREVVRRETEDGRIEVVEAVVFDSAGAPLMVDPLGHMTDADWQATDHKMRVSDSPGEKMQVAAMIPVAFRKGRVELLRLLALVLTSNADLEQWDTDGDVEERLDRAGKALMHDASIEELTELASAALALCREQIAGPFGRLMDEARATFTTPAGVVDGEPATVTPPAAAFETEASSISSTESPADTAGTPPPSSIEPASVS